MLLYLFLYSLSARQESIKAGHIFNSTYPLSSFIPWVREKWATLPAAGRELISYIDQLLNAIDQGSIDSIAFLAILAKTNRVGSSIDSSGGLLEKEDIMLKLNCETRKLVINITNQGCHIQCLGIGLSVLVLLFKRIGQVSSNRDECKQVYDHLPQEKLNQILQVIVQGSSLCISQMESHALSKFFAAPVAAEDLRGFQAGLIHEYSGLSLEAIINMLKMISIWLGIALSVVGFVLERIEQASSNKNGCIKLLKYMCNLAKYIKQLDLQFVVQGSLLCTSQMEFHAFSKYFAAPVAAEDLRRVQGRLIHSRLSLEAIIAVLNSIPVVLPPSQGRSHQAVGIEVAMNDVTELLDMKSESVKTVVTYGQGGMGKTTLATEVLSKLDLKNYKYCRVDIRQNCSQADLKFLQQQVLRNLHGRYILLKSLNEGREELSKDFKEGSSQPVFIFVDKALKQSDLEKLLPISGLASLPAQSRILLMTRNLNETPLILEEGVEGCHYPVASLPPEEARKLLCELALGSGQPGLNPTMDINGLLQICRGVPLVLKMGGVRLRFEHAQSEPACRHAVEYLKSRLLQGVEGELSERMVDFVYNRLEAFFKEPFFDIVFFFCTWKRDLVASSVEETYFQEFERAALVNIMNEGVVNVHDIVKVQGRMPSPDGERITDLQSFIGVLQDLEFLGIASSMFLPAGGHYAKA